MLSSKVPFGSASGGVVRRPMELVTPELAFTCKGAARLAETCQEK
jgi:hypothetical protein